MTTGLETDSTPWYDTKESHKTKCPTTSQFVVISESTPLINAFGSVNHVLKISFEFDFCLPTRCLSVRDLWPCVQRVSVRLLTYSTSES